MSQSYNPEQEVRFAVVMYGGVSLAIYINGVAQELLSAVRATANLQQGEKLSGSERVYRELGQLLSPDRKRGDAPLAVADPDDLTRFPIRTRIVVDIISGSSAGGINGVALAKALALRMRNLDVLKEVWLRRADLESLLNDNLSEPHKYPPHPDRRTVSLLNSERMYGMVLETLKEMNASAAPDSSTGAFADEIDLFVTTTDLAGLWSPIQLTGTKIDERIHKTVFHFRYSAPELANPYINPAQNEFAASFDPMLAFAARCTSSFPVAFEPMRFDRIQYQLNRIVSQTTVADAAKSYQGFFPAYNAQGQPFTNRLFADGGYLDNRPFSHVINLIQYRSSTRPVQRKLLFVDPFPEVAPAYQEAIDEVGFFKNAILAASTLPRYEVIRGDVQAVNGMNRQLDRLSALRERMEVDTGHLSQREQPDSPDRFEELDLKAMVDEHHYGHRYPPYHHLRVYDVSDALANLLTRLFGFEIDSDYHYFIRLIVRAWRQANYSAYKDERPLTENAFFTHFDADYRLRRLNHLRSLVDGRLASNRDTTDREDLRDFRAILELQILRLREIQRLIGSPQYSPLLELPQLGGVRQELESYYGRVMDQVDRDRRYEQADRVYELVRPAIDAIMAKLRDLLGNMFKANSDELKEQWVKLVIPEDRTALEVGYNRFHWHDALTLPVLQGTGAREHAEVEIYRVSPVDGSLKPRGLDSAADKLAGIQGAAFGGFAHREWRENDMMWGRLDGAERIVTALLPDPADKALRDHYVRKVQDAIVAEEFSATDPTKQDRIFACLAQELRKAGVTEVSADKLIVRGGEVLANFPSLQSIVNKQDFMTFLCKWYQVPPPPEPKKLATWAGRSLKIFGRMLDDRPTGQTTTRVGSVARTIGSLLTGLVRFATPGTLGREIATHFLMLIGLAGLVLLILGPAIGVQGVSYVGLTVIAGCLVAWLVQRIAGRILTGRSIWREAGTFIAIAVAIVLVILGFIKAWEFVQSLVKWIF